MNNQYPLECLYGSMNILTDGKGKPYYCSKLEKPIAPRDCFGCGWYKIKNDLEKKLEVKK